MRLTHTTNKIPLISLPHDVRFSFCEATARQYAKYVIYISVREVLVKFYSAGTGLQMHTGGMALVFVAKNMFFGHFGILWYDPIEKYGVLAGPRY